jgi:hypothetical protein
VITTFGRKEGRRQKQTCTDRDTDTEREREREREIPNLDEGINMISYHPDLTTRG